MTGAARYGGTCRACGHFMHQGDSIAKDGERWVHAACVGESSNDEAGYMATRPLTNWRPPGDPEPCPTCFLIHSKGGCDR